MPGRVREKPLPLRIRSVLIAVPIVMASADLFENGCIAVPAGPSREGFQLAYESEESRKSSRTARHYRKGYAPERAPAGRENTCHIRRLDGEKVFLKDQVLEAPNV
jgi:hypothetical protein